MSARTILFLAALGLVPIALSYGAMPSLSVPYLLGFSVEGTAQTHVFRAIMGLYLANVCFWLAGATNPRLRLPALWGLLIFMGGLAAGRILSLFLDGLPNGILIFYLVAEIVFATLAFIALQKHI